MSCGQLALERVGIKVDTYFASEIDKYAIQITQKNYPNTIQLGSVTELTSDKLKELGEIDLLIGGSPCQGFSFAGKQLNFDDPRSKLFFDYVRILETVKPKYFLLENTPMKKEYENVITSYLGVEPIMINSKLISAQSRKRLYWTNIPNIDQPTDKMIMLEDIVENDVLLEQSEVNKIIELVGANTKEHLDKEIKGTSKSVMLSNIYGGFGEKKPRVHFGKSVTIRAGAGGGHHPYLILQDKVKEFSLDNIKNCIRKVTPLECERLQTVPDNYTKGVSNAQRYKMIGNGWTIDVIAHVLKQIPLRKELEVNTYTYLEEINNDSIQLN